MVIGQSQPGLRVDWRYRIAVGIDAGRQVEPMLARDAVAPDRFVEIAAVCDARWQGISELVAIHETARQATARVKRRARHERAAKPTKRRRRVSPTKPMP